MLIIVQYFAYPALIGLIHWLIHKLTGRNDEKSRYQRKRVFGITLLLMLILVTVVGIRYAALVGTPEAGRQAGRELVFAVISVFIGKDWIKSIWQPYEKYLLKKSVKNIVSSSAKPEDTEPFDKEKVIDQKATSELDELKSNTLDPAKHPVDSTQDTVDLNPGNGSSRKTIESELIRLKDLYDRGLIDEQDYTKLKQKLLDI